MVPLPNASCSFFLVKGLNTAECYHRRLMIHTGHVRLIVLCDPAKGNAVYQVCETGANAEGIIPRTSAIWDITRPNPFSSK